MQTNFRARAGMAFNPAFAADVRHALLHIAQPVGQRIVRRIIKTTAIVLDHHVQGLFRETHP